MKTQIALGILAFAYAPIYALRARVQQLESEVRAVQKGVIPVSPRP